MYIEDKNELNRNTYLNMSDAEILKCIDEAIVNHNVDGYTQHYEPVKCDHCNNDTWFGSDVFDYIADKLRLHKAEQTMSEEEFLEFLKDYSRITSKIL